MNEPQAPVVASNELLGHSDTDERMTLEEFSVNLSGEQNLIVTQERGDLIFSIPSGDEVYVLRAIELGGGALPATRLSAYRRPKTPANLARESASVDQHSVVGRPNDLTKNGQ